MLMLLVMKRIKTGQHLRFCTYGICVFAYQCLEIATTFSVMSSIIEKVLVEIEPALGNHFHYPGLLARLRADHRITENDRADIESGATTYHQSRILVRILKGKSDAALGTILAYFHEDGTLPHVEKLIYDSAKKHGYFGQQSGPEPANGVTSSISTRRPLLPFNNAPIAMHELRNIVLNDRVALQNWSLIVPHLVPLAADQLKIQNMLKWNDFGEAVRETLEIWKAGGSSADLENVWREHGLKALADKTFGEI